MSRTSVSLLAAGLCAALFALPAQAATISIVADQWCPYNCEPGSDKPGFMIEIAQKVLAEAGHTVDYKNLPWSRAIDEARKGKYNAIVGAAVDDAPDFEYPGSPLGISKSVFAVPKGSSWKFTGMDSLAAVSIGTIQDYAYSEEFDAYVEANAKDAKKIQVATGDDALTTNIRKLEANRIGALVEDESVLNYELAQMATKTEFAIVGDLGESELFIAFTPGKPESKEYAKLLGEGVEKLRASGELAKILAKYGLKDWK